MTDQAIEFLQEWVHDHVDRSCLKKRVPLPQQAHELTQVCERDAAAAGVTLDDITEEVGDLNELIESKLEDVSETDVTKAPKPR